MFERIKRLFESGRLTERGVANAVERGLITAQQAEEILGGDNENENEDNGR